jgi:hypothetical protein
MRRYQKFFTGAITLIFIVANSSSAYSATKPRLVADAFENYLESIDSTYNAEMLNASSLYQPQVDLVTQKIKDAKSKFLASNQVKVVKFGDFRNY